MPNDTSFDGQDDDHSLENIKFGDVVYFTQSTPVHGFVHADRCFGRVGFQTSPGSKEPSNFDDCLFEVMPMLSYDAMEMAKHIHNPESSSEQAMVKARLKQEDEQNANLMKICEVPPGDGSEELRYGQVIQLRHLSTGKFLSGNSVTAQVEKVRNV